MRLLRGLSAASLMSCLLLLLCVFVSVTVAQGNLPQLTGSTDNAIPTASSPPPTSSASSASASTTDSSSTSNKADSSSSTSNSNSDQSSSSSSPSSTSASSSHSTSSKSTSSSQPPPPKITSTIATKASSTTSDDPGLPSGLPTLSGAYNYPPPTVPPTQNAPFMRKSNLPEGTVFICVGAGLAFLGLGVIAWRGLVAWSLHRSVKRAAMAQTYGDKHSMLRGPTGFYAHGPGSTLSLEQLNGNGNRRTSTARPKSHHASSAKNSLFFSPTAGTGMHTTSNRGSSYLPAGYYAAGNAAPAGGAGMTHVGTGPISLSSLGPHSQGYSRAKSLGPSPPGSPALPPSRGAEVNFGRSSTAALSTQASMSSLNLSTPHQGRAPSAYLEDLFEHYPPVPAGRPSTDRRESRHG